MHSSVRTQHLGSISVFTCLTHDSRSALDHRIRQGSVKLHTCDQQAGSGRSGAAAERGRRRDPQRLPRELAQQCQRVGAGLRLCTRKAKRLNS